LRWTGDPNVLYRVQVAKDSAFAVDVVVYETKGPQLTLAKPAPGEYYVRVQTVDAAGRAGAYSDAQRLDIPGTVLPWPLLLLLAIIVLF